jgi:hypothetical protein
MNWPWHRSTPAWAVDLSRQMGQLIQQGQKLMSKVTDFATAVNAAFDKLSTDLDTIKTGIAALDAAIAAFQNSPGTLSAADQAALDDIQAKSQALVVKADAIDTTPPAPPVV